MQGLGSFHPPLALLVGSVAPSISLSIALFPPAGRTWYRPTNPNSAAQFQFLPLVAESETLPLTLVRSDHTPPRPSISASQHTLPFSIVRWFAPAPPLLPLWLEPGSPARCSGLAAATPQRRVPRRRGPAPRLPEAALPRLSVGGPSAPPVRPAASRSPWSARAVPRTAPVPGAPSEVAAGHRGPWSCAPCAHVPGPPVPEARSPRGSGPARPLPW